MLKERGKFRSRLARLAYNPDHRLLVSGSDAAARGIADAKASATIAVSRGRFQELLDAHAERAQSEPAAGIEAEGEAVAFAAHG